MKISNITSDNPKYNERGEEIMDSTPITLPVGFNKPEPLDAMIKRLVKNQLSRDAQKAGYESFDDADDFDIPDDPIDPSTPYEAEFDGPAVNEPAVNLAGLSLKKAKAEEKMLKAKAEADAKKAVAQATVLPAVKAENETTTVRPT